jgi:hypothetical protein
MSISYRSAVALVVALLSLAVAARVAAAAVQADRLITAKRVGVIGLGMTLAEARKSARGASFTRASDGDGAALVQITFAPNASMQVWADEDDPEKPIDWRRRILTIETFSPAFRTAEGAHPGAAISELNGLYGKTKSIETSEVESRRYITFDRHPAGLTFRVDETGEAILSIAVTTIGDR